MTYYLTVSKSDEGWLNVFKRIIPGWPDFPSSVISSLGVVIEIGEDLSNIFLGKKKYTVDTECLIDELFIDLKWELHDDNCTSNS